LKKVATCLSFIFAVKIAEYVYFPFNLL
jgi:hypothetical protein